MRSESDIRVGISGWRYKVSTANSTLRLDAPNCCAFGTTEVVPFYKAHVVSSFFAACLARTSNSANLPLGLPLRSGSFELTHCGL